MVSAKRATIATAVGRSIDGWVRSATRYVDGDAFQLRALDHDLDKLFKADAYAASLLRGTLHQLLGDADNALYWVHNARRLRGDPASELRSDGVEAMILSNLGYFSRASSLLAKEGKDADRCHPVLLYLCGAWNELARLPVTVDLSHDEVAMMQTVRRRSSLCQQIGVSQAQIQAVLDVAGEVLRERRMFFLGDRPLVRDCDDAVLYQLHVPAHAVEAAAMTASVIERLVQRDLDVAGFAFSFLPG